jgi:prophage tail gpP-like protein
MVELGGERVRIVLGEVESYVIQRYEIRQSFFTQPSTFSLRVGHGALAMHLLEVFHPGLAFALYIDLPDGRAVLQMSGRIDACGTEGGAGATEVTLRGRDWMQPLHDGMPAAERTFGRATFADLTESVIALAGVDEATLFFDDAANSAAVQGIPKTEKSRETVTREFVIEDGKVERLALVSTGEAAGSPFAYDVLPATMDKIVQQADVTREVTKVVGYDVPNPLKLSLGNSYLHFLQQEHNRTGLFLFAAADPRTYVLTRPNVLAAPTWRIVRRRGMSWGIEGCSFNNDTAGRFSHYVVRGRGGGGTDSTGAVRKQIEGIHVDQEMVDYGLIKTWSKVDQIAKTSKQAEYLARRYAAERARAGWHLTYTLRGLSWPTIAGGDLACWTRNTVVDVQDEELGIFGPHWLSDVAQSGGERTTSTISLHKPDHQVYGDEVLPSRVPGKKGKKS